MYPPTKRERPVATSPKASMTVGVPDMTAPTSPARPVRRWPSTAATAAAVVGLAVAGYWGHRHDWRLPSSGDRPAGTPDAAPVMRVEAGPALAPGGPCPAHGLPICPICRPAVAQVAITPKPTEADRERMQRALAVRPRPLGDVTALRLPRVVRFSSSSAPDEAGIDITPAWAGPAVEAVSGSAELVFDPARYARLSSRAAGTAWRVLGRVGDTVRVGDVLALVDAAEVGRAKAALQVALVQVRLKSQAAMDLAAAPVQERQRAEAQAAQREAEVRLLAAEQALVNLGLPPPTGELRALSAAEVADRLPLLGVPADLARGPAELPPPGTLLPVRAPRDGVVLKADVVAGEAVEPGKVLFVVADPSGLRLMVHVAPNDAGLVKVGQAVRFRPDGAAAEAVGRVSWVGVTADETTRKVPVWADVPNPDGRMRVATLGTAGVVLREEPAAVLVPAVAVQFVGEVPVVFVRDKGFLSPDGPKTFHVRPIVVGPRTGKEIEIIAGLWPGEVVATKGSEVLLNELRKDLAVGAGGRHE
jgi:cobalt-zinc-cadmium efflux system membrane fusion protein